MTTISKGSYDNFVNSKGMLPPPIPLGTISIREEIKLDLIKDFNAWKKAYEKERLKRLKKYHNNFMSLYGQWYDDEDSWWDDDAYGYYPYFDDCYFDNKPVSKDKKKKKKSGIASQRFVNGIEVDPDITDDEAEQLYKKSIDRKSHKKRKGGKKKRYEGGTTSRLFQDEEDEWYNESASLDPDNDFQFERYVEEELNNEEKKIVFYRHLNNTADSYEFSSISEFSDWIKENEINVNDNDAYAIVYADETHCALDPQADKLTLVCASNYEDLVYFITGGDAIYLAELSTKHCPV